MSTSHTPKGDIVTSPPAQPPSPTKTLIGNYTTLIPLSPSHIPELYSSLGGPENDSLYTYLPAGPFHDLESFSSHITSLLASPIFFPYTIFKDEEAVGVVAYMNITPQHMSIEIGHVLFGEGLKRTRGATEVNYLLMREAFEVLGYQRVEWKTNTFNEPSKKAALRLGFTHEGIFRKHLVVKGRRRDTAWYSCLDDEWFKAGKGSVKRGLEKWLESGNFDEQGRQILRLEEVRKGLV